MVRVSGPDGRQRIKSLSIGQTERLRVPTGGESEGGGDVSLAVEQPHDGAELDAGALTTTVIGQASEIAQAGLTKIAIVIDTSGSTADPSGSDADVEGSETVLDAEKAAAEALISALVEVENDAPGTAFAISVIEFGDTAHSLSPLLPLTEPLAIERLTRAVSALSHGVQGGSTFYDRAINVALRVLASSDRPGPEFILLVTDGKPSQIVPAIDASARAGLEDVVLHTIGLGTDFRGDVPEDISYPPVSEAGPVVLAKMAAFSSAGGRVWALPTSADVVALVPTLPVLERQDAGIRSVSIFGTKPSTWLPKGSNCVRTGPSRRAFPVAFGPPYAGWSNVLSITATGVSGATARREIRLLAAGPRPRAVGAGRG